MKCCRWRQASPNGTRFARLLVPLLSLICVALILGANRSVADSVLTSPDPAELRNALQKGGTVTLAFDGSLSLTQTLEIATNTVLDATGHSVVLNGNNSVRLFLVQSNISFTLLHLRITGALASRGAGLFNDHGQVTIRRCSFQANQATNQDAAGGAIFSAHGVLNVSDTDFTTNQATAGQLIDVSAPAAQGGAIAVDGGTVNLGRCHFSRNHASGGMSLPAAVDAVRGKGSGGAIALRDAAVTIENCVFESNLAQSDAPSPIPDRWTGADGAGGAIAQTAGSLVMGSCAFLQNVAAGGNGSRNSGNGRGYGGAVASDGELQATDCTFERNQASGAGGISFFGADSMAGALYSTGSAALEGCVFNSNQARAGVGCNCGNIPGTSQNGSGMGGAIFSDGSLSISSCAFLSNWVDAPDSLPMFGPTLGGSYGGALYSRGVCAITNSTWYQNLAVPQRQNYPAGLPSPVGPATGSAIFKTNAPLMLAFCTIASNSIPSTNIVGSAVHLADGSSAQLGGCILSGNSTFNLSGNITDTGNNISSDASAAFTLASSRTNLDALLGALGYTASGTPTLALRPGSPAIDAVEGLCPPTDERGVLRPIGPRCDIGAYEFVPPAMIGRGTNNQLQVTAILQPSREFQIEESSDLKFWTLFTEGSSDAQGRLTFRDTVPGNPRARFYRARTAGP